MTIKSEDTRNFIKAVLFPCVERLFLRCYYKEKESCPARVHHALQQIAFLYDSLCDTRNQDGFRYVSKRAVDFCYNRDLRLSDLQKDMMRQKVEDLPSWDLVEPHLLLVQSYLDGCLKPAPTCSKTYSDLKGYEEHRISHSEFSQALGERRPRTDQEQMVGVAEGVTNSSGFIDFNTSTLPGNGDSSALLKL